MWHCKKVFMSFRTQVRVVNGRLSLLPVTIEQFLNHAVCGSRCLFCQKITRLPRKNYLSQSERSPRHVTVRLSGSAISKTRLIWLKQAIMLPDKRGPNSRRRGGEKRNFMGRRLYRKWHFCVKGGFLEECPCWMEPSWRMDWARPQSGVLQP